MMPRENTNLLSVEKLHKSKVIKEKEDSHEF